MMRSLNRDTWVKQPVATSWRVVALLINFIPVIILEVDAMSTAHVDSPALSVKSSVNVLLTALTGELFMITFEAYRIGSLLYSRAVGRNKLPICSKRKMWSCVIRITL